MITQAHGPSASRRRSLPEPLTHRDTTPVRDTRRTAQLVPPAAVALASHLVAEHIELAGTEATGIYWKPVFAALEDRLACWLLNAHHMHNV
ncbi:hypothetical protein ABZZ74_52700, partial [Streptomyces sp. NPDC006476]